MLSLFSKMTLTLQIEFLLLLFANCALLGTSHGHVQVDQACLKIFSVAVESLGFYEKYSLLIFLAWAYQYS